MLIQFFKFPSRVHHFSSGPGGPLLEDFAQFLDQSGYSRNIGARHLRAAAHLFYWANSQDIDASKLDQKILGRFAEHLNKCQCPSFTGMDKKRLIRGARVFLAYKRSASADSSVDDTASLKHGSVLFAAFCQWMRQKRGSSERTLEDYGAFLRSLLEEIGEDPGKLNIKLLRQFILNQSQKQGLARVKSATSALRMFIRFLISEGKCTPGLDAGIPSMAYWRLSTLPRYLQADEVERVIASCDLTKPVGKRDRAILLLLARLGLRAGDVLHLRLGDINWKGASITVSGKNKQQTQLPLTQEVGQAIVDYLQQGRPRTDTDRLFVRSLAPFRAFRDTRGISGLVKQAMRRANVQYPPHGAAHVLRHSFATSMLCHGASLQDIATILRHQSIGSTQIYAKVDVTALHEIVQTWPEEWSC